MKTGTKVTWQDQLRKDGASETTLARLEQASGVKATCDRFWATQAHKLDNLARLKRAASPRY